MFMIYVVLSWLSESFTQILTSWVHPFVPSFQVVLYISCEIISTEYVSAWLFRFWHENSNVCILCTLILLLCFLIEENSHQLFLLSYLIVYLRTSVVNIINLNKHWKYFRTGRSCLHAIKFYSDLIKWDMAVNFSSTLIKTSSVNDKTHEILPSMNIAGKLRMVAIVMRGEVKRLVLPLS